MSINAISPEYGPDDFDDHSLAKACEHARKLLMAGDYGGAINALLPYAEQDKEAAGLMGECLRELGMEGKAVHYFAIAGSDRSGANSPCQPENRKRFISGAMARLEQSLTEDREIWQSLSSR